ncbi:MAG: hypothetical protein QOH26_9 [Actinomycetota bacterium]|jgi:excisionase family DNA binding protein|nr:hypothetical protein [Actinomycetota bacterium]
MSDPIAPERRRTRTIQEFAAAAGIHPKTAYELARTGSLPVPVIRIGRKLLIPADAIEQLLVGNVDPPGGATPDDLAPVEGGPDGRAA